jgi:hypothetical protein
MEEALQGFVNGFVGSFNDAISIEIMALGDGIADEREKIWKEVVVA